MVVYFSSRGLALEKITK